MTYALSRYLLKLNYKSRFLEVSTEQYLTQETQNQTLQHTSLPISHQSSRRRQQEAEGSML